MEEKIGLLEIENRKLTEKMNRASKAFVIDAESDPDSGESLSSVEEDFRQDIIQSLTALGLDYGNVISQLTYESMMTQAPKAAVASASSRKLASEELSADKACKGFSSDRTDRPKGCVPHMPTGVNALAFGEMLTEFKNRKIQGLDLDPHQSRDDHDHQNGPQEDPAGPES